MRHETLICLENVASDQLSALRDEALPAGEAVKLRAHIASCATCQARMADFDRLARALRDQRELDPGDRILDGAHARLAEQSRPARGWRGAWNAGGGRRVWAGLAALAPVAALILLFVYVFSGIARHPATSATPTTATATPIGQKPVYPTPTPSTVQLPTYTQAVSSAIAWGAVAPVKRLTIAPSGGYAFNPQVFSSDLTTVGGNLQSVAPATPLQEAPYREAPLALYNIATGAITRLGPTGDVFAMDSRYIVYGFNNQVGASCGVCNNTIWSLDRATGKTWRIDPGPKYAGELDLFASADHVVFVTIQNQVWVADLAAHTVSLALPIGAQPATASSTSGPQEQIMGFQWPYLIYDETSAETSTSPPATTLNMLDLATGVNTHVTAHISDQSANPAAVSTSPSGVALVGKTLYATITTQLNGVDTQGRPVNATYGELYRLDNTFAPGGQFTFLARWPIGGSNHGSGAQPNARLISLGSGYFWDLAEQRLVLSPIAVSLVVGPYLITEDPQPADIMIQTYHITVYDSSTFAFAIR